jgi:hypothetical protein
MVRLGPSRFGVELKSRQVTNALHVCRSPCQKKSEVTVDNPGFEVGRKEGDDEGPRGGKRDREKGR